MPKYLYRGVILLFAVALVSGCGVRAKRYVQVRDRVDLEQAGNAGYFGGKPKEMAKPSKDTRKMYVLEFTRESEEPEMVVARPQAKEEPVQRRRRRAAPPKRERRAPPRLTPVETEPSFVDYTIKKNDTLQKISKEFYDGYSKWPRIYDANKDVIKDPNRLRVGTVIRVPVD